MYIIPTCYALLVGNLYAYPIDPESPEGNHLVSCQVYPCTTNKLVIKRTKTKEKSVLKQKPVVRTLVLAALQPGVVKQKPFR